MFKRVLMPFEEIFCFLYWVVGGGLTHVHGPELCLRFREELLRGPEGRFRSRIRRAVGPGFPPVHDGLSQTHVVGEAGSDAETV